MSRTQDPTDQLLDRLTRELFQTETSASRHCRREAERLGQASGATAFREIARHADRVLGELPVLTRSAGLPDSPGGTLLGATFSQFRDGFADKLIDRERSYRGTILGLRHGVDLVRLYEPLAERSGRIALRDFCRSWLELRAPLVERVASGLLWFADHPERALERARPLFSTPRPAA